MKGKKLEFLKTDGTRIITKSGKEILLRGMGLGGWFLPEGYMWRLYGAYDRPRRLERLVADLAGEEFARQFWDQYLDNYISREDIRWIAEQGFNSVRVPLNARTLASVCDDEVALNADILARLDALVKWCREYGVYAILDMHGAPGGQTGTNIDDSERDLPELFMDARYQDELIEIWRLLAMRFSGEPAIAGYDLLNEPLAPTHIEYSPLVLPLYERLARAIRTVDKRHMLILEGVHWATDWSIFEPLAEKKFDGNCVLQFHKYWSEPDKESVTQYVTAGKRYSMPIFMGEGGENNCAWYTGLFPMLEDLRISWNFWSFKKMGCDNSPLSIDIPDGWESIVNYAEKGTPVDRERACAIFSNFLAGLRYDSCKKNTRVISALNREEGNPIPAEYYLSSDEPVGYVVRSARKVGAQLRMSDPVSILFEDNRVGVPNYKKYAGEPQAEKDRLRVSLEPGELLRYRFRIRERGIYRIECVSSGALAVSVDGTALGVVDQTDKGETVATILAEGDHIAEFRSIGGRLDFYSWSFFRESN